MQPYEPRPVEFHGVRAHGGWRIKTYSIRYGERPVDWPAFEPGLDLALSALPRPARVEDEGRAGVGFVIAHQGRNADYIVLGWWDRENELPLRVFLREEGASWRPARGSESFCVWDLQVLWREREAYVGTFLDLGCADPAAAYLDRHLAIEPAIAMA